MAEVGIPTGDSAASGLVNYPMRIEAITSRTILDSRGRPTLETTVHVDVGVSGTASVPSGASTGSHEAVELRDRKLKAFGGLGVQQAMKNVMGPIAKALQGHDVRQQSAIDELMINLDGTVNKSKLGANAILSVSLAVTRAAAALQHQSLYRWIQQVYELPEVDVKHLPRPMMNILNGGKHADTALPVQEFLIMPKGKTVLDQLERGVAVYQALRTILSAKHLRTTVGDEGGFAPALKDPKIALEFLTKSITAAGLEPGKDISLGLDVAANELYNPATKRYRLGDTAGGLASAGVTSLMEEWLDAFPISSIEDPLAEDDWEGWRDLTAQLGSRTMLVGDDLFVTDVNRLQRGIENKVANAILIKPNQVGTLSQTVAAIRAALESGYTPIISNRSGETTDPFIADLAVAVQSPLIKTGAPARGERVAKYNRLLQIAEELAT